MSISCLPFFLFKASKIEFKVEKKRKKVFEASFVSLMSELKLLVSEQKRLRQKKVKIESIDGVGVGVDFDGIFLKPILIGLSDQVALISWQ